MVILSTAIISDHLPWFAIIPDMFGNTASNKFNIQERDWCKFNWENSVLHYFSINREDLLKIYEPDVDNWMQVHLDRSDMLLNIDVNKYLFKRLILRLNVDLPWAYEK